TSPLGARTMTRGTTNPVANSVTLNPSGALGHAPSGRLTGLGWLLAEGVSYGVARSSTVILRRTPGASVVQSPRAAPPVQTGAPARARVGGPGLAAGRGGDDGGRKEDRGEGEDGHVGSMDHRSDSLGDSSGRAHSIPSGSSSVPVGPAAR